MTERRLLFSLTAASVALLLLSLFLGPTPISPLRAVAALFGSGSEADQLVIQAIRLPRTIAAFLVGGSLAMAGAALQGLLRNPLAEPGVLGITSGAILGATLTLAFGAAVPIFSVPVAAIAGALGTTALVAAVAIRVRSVSTLILFGIGLSSIIGALMSLILSLAPTPFTLAEIINWSFGTVANRSWQDLWIAGPMMAAGASILLSARRGFDLLTFGEELAAGAGLDLKSQQAVTVIGAGLLTGAAVSVAGGIGFIGIVAPHIIRPLTGHRPGASLLPAAMTGGILIIGADLLLRILPFGAELRLGVVAALIGAPVFILIALQRRGIS
ncbi:iron ABC transporter permease [Parvularcula sp. ZS-1/3]|uniref:Iron ABC transporter permease n=1 Tax=Parvularcula mediterranea TaxID=2732508 RepID=A0A7Y3W425_9PROT|nr:iron ABC transporter permease [Parvularcula mediterranea]NNU14736.1 iron ABC transporter permease [Parvularcula mediterranea]